jgi:hypothetical protein
MRDCDSFTRNYIPKRYDIPLLIQATHAKHLWIIVIKKESRDYRPFERRQPFFRKTVSTGAKAISGICEPANPITPLETHLDPE